ENANTLASDRGSGSARSSVHRRIAAARRCHLHDRPTKDHPAEKSISLGDPARVAALRVDVLRTPSPDGSPSWPAPRVMSLRDVLSQLDRVATRCGARGHADHRYAEASDRCTEKARKRSEYSATTRRANPVVRYIASKPRTTPGLVTS